MIPSGLIVSCQALEGNPFRDSERLAYMAEAATLGGATAIRANGPYDIAAMCKRTNLPIIGIDKRKDPTGRTVITPDFAGVKAVAEAGASAIAMDCTFYESTIREDRAELIQRIHEELKIPVLADISTLDEAVWAASIGADAVSTTLSGYIPGAEFLPWQQYIPNFTLLSDILKQKLPIKVYGEGRFWSGEDVTEACRLGVDGVIIGKSITNPMATTRYFVNCANKAKAEPVRTEERSPETTEIDKVSTVEVLNLINNAEKNTANIVGAAVPELAELVDTTVEAIRRGGRVFYVGAGTSARLAAADAAECPPTYGVSREMFQAVVAGGYGALVNASESTEDDGAAAQKAFAEFGVKPGDVVVGISVAGKAPFVVSFMKEAKSIGCTVGAFVNNPDTPMEQIADYTVHLYTGAEAIKGSTRMKAGTAQKMLLNMFSTSICVKLGYTYSNYMVNMKAVNTKLKDRAVKMFSDITGENETVSKKFLEENNWTVSEAIRSWKKAD